MKQGYSNKMYFPPWEKSEMRKELKKLEKILLDVQDPYLKKELQNEIDLIEVYLKEYENE